MINTKLVTGLVTIWRANPILTSIPVTTTTLPERIPIPYAQMSIVNTSHEFDSSLHRVEDYTVTITVFCQQDKAAAAAISDALAAAYDFANLYAGLLLAGATVLLFIPDSEDVTTARQTDPTAHDVNILTHTFRIQVFE
jgi:hypothetical protein